MPRPVNLSGCLPWLIVGVCFVCLFPAVDSRFLMDDFSNLSRLEILRDSDLLTYLFGGTAGPTGRPVALFTFALQADAWPQNPAAFKIVNLLLHCVNGLLIFWISRRIIARYRHYPDRVNTFLSGLITGLWFVHPIQQSTVFYVVQRMNELSALFCLLAVWCYLRYRPRLTDETPRHSFIRLTVLLLPCAALSVFSKENGILLFLYLFLLERLLFADMPPPTQIKYLLNLLLLLPLVTLAGYLIYTYPETVAGYQFRPWTVGERLLTQINVIMDYLRIILLPYYSDFTFYHDEYPIAAMFSPSLWLKGAGLIVVLSWCLLGKRLPLVRLGFLWFFCGHALEASHVNLEMFFEHRNYLPSYGLILALVTGVHTLYHYFSRRWLVWVMGGMYGLNIISIAALHLTLWQNPVMQSMEWSRLNPESRWAALDTGSIYMLLGISEGKFDRVETFYNDMAAKYPDSIIPMLELLKIDGCYKHLATGSAEWSRLFEQARLAKRYRLQETVAFHRLVEKILHNECPAIDAEALLELMRVVADNDSFAPVAGYIEESIISLEKGMQVRTSAKGTGKFSRLP